MRIILTILNSVLIYIGFNVLKLKDDKRKIILTVFIGLSFILGFMVGDLNVL